jgi:CRP-like cAMP-binding protein
MPLPFRLPKVATSISLASLGPGLTSSACPHLVSSVHHTRASGEFTVDVTISVSESPVGHSGNLLLDTLTPERLLSLNHQEADHRIGIVLIKPEETPRFVYFPHRGAVVSIVRSTEDGLMVEAGVIGSEGAFPVPTIIAEPAPTGSQALTQIDGRFSRVDAVVLRNLFNEDVALRDRLLSFTSLFLTQVTQNLVCNRLHAIEQRLAKWLLIVRDRIDTDDLHLTQDFLAHMLGIHRPGVSIAVTALEQNGLIRHRRNHIVIRDHDGLAAHSCECYGVVHSSLVAFRSTFAI